MPITIRVHIAEKRSTTSQYENATVGADIEATGLEISSPDEIHAKTRELLQIARSAIQGELLAVVPEQRSPRENVNGNGHANRLGNRTPSNGRGSRRGAGNGRRRSFGRPNPEPTAKQKQFLRKIARERQLDAQAVGEICQRVVGLPLRSCTKDDVSKLINALLEEAA